MNYQPKQCTIIRKLPQNDHIHLHCFIPQQNGLAFNDPFLETLQDQQLFHLSTHPSLASNLHSQGFFLHPPLAHMSPFPPILVSSLAHSLGTILEGVGCFGGNTKVFTPSGQIYPGCFPDCHDDVMIFDDQGEHYTNLGRQD